MKLGSRLKLTPAHGDRPKPPTIHRNRPKPPLSCGDRPKPPPVPWGLNAFIKEEGGYTSITVAISLLLSLTLCFSLVSATWVQNRSADIQSVADAAALSGQTVVSSYKTLASVIDACILTMGLAGVATIGAGLVISAVPGLSSAGVSTMDAGNKILTSRQKFATSAARGMQKLEATLPLLIVARSSAVVAANTSFGASYIGCAVPYPTESQSDFSGLDAELDTSAVNKSAEELQEASDKAKEAQDVADDALLRGWLADCGNSPRNMYERASHLAGLSAENNPYYSSYKKWTFGAALLRARAYYAVRVQTETPLGAGIEYAADSAVRKAFYEYALEQVNAATYRENADGTVEIDFPSLPSNTDEMKRTHLYTDARWPCSDEAQGRTAHATLECPGAKGPASGMAAISEIGAGVLECATCHLDAFTMGNVAAASTSIDNGFEHYWREVVEASKEYERASNELAEANVELESLSSEASDAFNALLETLAVPRPKLCPPGAYGCVAAVWRQGELSSSEAFSSVFSEAVEVGSGAAVSAAVLAPDENTDEQNVLTNLFSSIDAELGSTTAGVLGNFGSLWSGILDGYASFYDGASSGITSALNALDGIPFASAASKLCSALNSLVENASFAPTDLRAFKPVLTNSQNVIDKAGDGGVASARQIIELLGQSSNTQQFAETLGQELQNRFEGQEVTLAEIPIPGTDIEFPLTINLGDLAEGVFS